MKQKAVHLNGQFAITKRGTPGSTPPNGTSQRKSNNVRLATQNDSAVPAIVDEVLRTPGRPLDAETRAFMEPRFGHDFGQVRVHTEAKAAESAQAVNALAYTVGRDVVFADGQYAPGAERGRRLLAHELAHVLQQRKQSDLQEKLEVSQPGDLAEGDADHVAEQVMRGQSGAPATRTTGVMLQRTPDVGFTVHAMNLDKGLLDDPTDAGGKVTWPLSFAVTSPLEAKPDVEVTGSAGDPCANHSVGFLQTVHIQWIHIHYRDQSAGDGSSMLSFAAPLPIRDGDPGDMWYTTDGVDTPAACNTHISPHMDDYPTLWDIDKVRTNSLTTRSNYLTYITRGIHFVTTLADSGPTGVTPLRFFYWNYLMDIEFTPNYATPNAVWPFNWKKNTANIGKVHTGGDSSVPMFTTASKPYNQSLTLKTTENA